MNGSKEEKMACAELVRTAVSQEADNSYFSYVESKQESEADFYVTYGDCFPWDLPGGAVCDGDSADYLL